jgi:hypothetical protein
MGSDIFHLFDGDGSIGVGEEFFLFVFQGRFALHYDTYRFMM